MNFIVTSVYKEHADGHDHLAGVCVSGRHFSVDDVVRSMGQCNHWYSQGGGFTVEISRVERCHLGISCTKKPYIKTNPDSTKQDSLEYLDLCVFQQLHSSN